LMGDVRGSDIYGRQTGDVYSKDIIHPEDEHGFMNDWFNPELQDKLRTQSNLKPFAPKVPESEFNRIQENLKQWKLDNMRGPDIQPGFRNHLPGEHDPYLPRLAYDRRYDAPIDTTPRSLPWQSLPTAITGSKDK
jgi:hypothetical protein